MHRLLVAALVVLSACLVLFMAYVIADDVTGKTVITRGTVTRRQFNPEWTQAAVDMPMDDKGNTMHVPSIHYDASWSIQLQTMYGGVELTMNEEAGKLISDGQGMMLRVRIGGRSHHITSATEFKESQ